MFGSRARKHVTSDDERQRDPVRDGRARHAERARLGPAFGHGLAVAHVGDEDHGPGPQRPDRRYADDPNEHLLRHHVVEQDADQHHRRRDGDAHGGNVPRVDLAEKARRLPELGQGVEHPSGAEDAAVARGGGRRDHDEVDDPPRRRNADPLEHHDERALLGVELVPGDERHDDDQGADVEDQDAPYHGVDRAAGAPSGDSRPRRR